MTEEYTPYLGSVVQLVPSTEVGVKSENNTVTNH